MLEESDEKFQINYRNNSNKAPELSGLSENKVWSLTMIIGSESPTGRRDFKNRREDHHHHHRKGNNQHAHHKNYQESKNSKKQHGKNKNQTYNQVQNENEDNMVDDNEEIAPVENTLVTNPNPEIQNVIWNQNQYNIM